jgi:hypothetical protein
MNDMLNEYLQTVETLESDTDDMPSFISQRDQEEFLLGMTDEPLMLDF